MHCLLSERRPGSFSVFGRCLFVSEDTAASSAVDVSGHNLHSSLAVGAARLHCSAGVQDTVDLGDSSDSSSSEGTGGLTASGGNTAPTTPDAASGGLLAAASVAAPAAGPSSNITAVTLASDPTLVRALVPYSLRSILWFSDSHVMST